MLAENAPESNSMDLNMVTTNKAPTAAHVINSNNVDTELNSPPSSEKHELSEPSDKGKTSNVNSQIPTTIPALLNPEEVPIELVPSSVGELLPSGSTSNGKSIEIESEFLQIGDSSSSSSSKAPARPRPDSFVEIQLGVSNSALGAGPNPTLASASGSGSKSPQRFDEIEQAGSSSSMSYAEASSRTTRASKTEHKPENPPATEYYLKTINWSDPKTRVEKVVRIVTQNENGPCPLVALANVLLLRGDIEIIPFDRPYVTYEYMAELLGDYLLNHAPAESNESEVMREEASIPKQDEETKKEEEEAKMKIYDYRYNLNAALSVIPNLQTGLDVNVRFTNCRAFEPTPELALFDAFNTDVVHGWLPDPQDEETYAIVVNKAGSYNKAVELVVAGDVAGQGVVVESTGESRSSTENSSTSGKRPEIARKSTWGVGGVTVKEALITSQFLDSTATQLTYYGLQFLMDSLPENNLCILFRNNHFSTLYKHPGTSSLYTLVTDAGFVNERAVVWESLRDIDQAAAEFYDGWFFKTEFSGPSGTGTGDWVGLNGRNTELENEDYALALKLQRLENARARQQRDRYGDTQVAKMIDLRAAGTQMRMASGTGMGIGGLPPENIGVAAKEIARRQERGKGRAVPINGEDKEKKKDSCMIM